MDQPSTAAPGRQAIGQNPDIRFLGRLLGDVIRDQSGEALFRRIEYIRSTSVAIADTSLISPPR